MSRALPALMFHSVANATDLAPHGWLQRLSTPPHLLDRTFDYWRRHGWRTITLDEASDWLDGRGSIPKKSLLLTLDDGYLDNWVALDPLLAAYGFRAAVFVSTDFIDPRPVRRPQLDQSRNLEWKGYLSGEEMCAMERKGTVEIASHAKTHTWWWVSDRIVDWYRPANRLTERESLLRFLWLNGHADRKPFALTEMQAETVLWGTPIYEFAPALIARRFHPDPAEASVATEYVTAHGGAAFFDRPGWREDLEREVSRYRAGRGPAGEVETENEYQARVLDELESSRRILGTVLGRDVRMLSCPQGAMTPFVEKAAAEVGYRRWTMSVWRHRALNRPGISSRHIYRCGRGYELFGSGRDVASMIRSHAIVLARYSGSPWGRCATATLSALARVTTRANGDIESI